MTIFMLPSRNRSRKVILTGICIYLCVLLLASCTSPSDKKGAGQAAIVVQHSDGSITHACVSFQGEEISGEDLLNQSGISYVADFGNSMGSILCSIEGEGCNFPSEKCFCQCSEPGSCSYWSYFIRDESGDWIYAPIGARLREIHDGDVDAWIWVEGAGFGQIEDTTIMPNINFEDICKG